MDSSDQLGQPLEIEQGNWSNTMVYAKDVVLAKGDSIRIGIIHPTEKKYSYPKPQDIPDLLLLSAYGQDSARFSLDQFNIGMVTNNTYFRVNRNFYALTSLDSTRQHIKIQKLDRRPSVPVAAELNARFKQVAVKTMSGQDTLIRHDPERQTILYFFTLGRRKGLGLIELQQELKSLGNKAPRLIPINRTDSQQNLEAFIEEHQLDTPIYKGAISTCDGLQCRPELPYAMLINESGRVVSYYIYPKKLNRLLEELR